MPGLQDMSTEDLIRLRDQRRGQPVPVEKPEVPDEPSEAPDIGAMSTEELQAILRRRQESREAKVPQGMGTDTGDYVDDTDQRGFWGSLWGSITGDVPNIEFKDAPEFSPSWLTEGKAWTDPESRDRGTRVGLGMFATQNPEAQADIILKEFPDTTFARDSFGNVMIKVPGHEWAYMNRPGLSNRDVVGTVGDLAKYAGAAGIANKAPFGVPGRVGAAGLGTAGTHVMSDTLAQMLGSRQGISPWESILAGVFGAGGQLGGEAASAILPKLWRAMPWSKGLVDSSGRLNQRGIDVARRLGIDPATITPEIARKMDELARTVPPSAVNAYLKHRFNFEPEARNAIRARLSPSDIPYTVGEATGDPIQQAAELAMERGSRGQKAQKILLDFREQRQRPAVQRATDRMTGTNAASAGEVAGEIGDAVRTNANKAWASVGQRYDEVAQMPGAFTPESFADFVEGLPTRLNSQGHWGNSKAESAINYLRSQVPPSARVGQLEWELANLEATGASPAQIKAARKALEAARTDTAGLTGMDLHQVEAARQTVLRSLRYATDPADRAAMGEIISAMDDWYDTALNRALVSGDAKQIREALDAARSARREYGQDFGQNNISRAQFHVIDDAGKFIEDIVSGRLTNEEIAARLFSSQTGAQGRAVAARTLDRMAKIFGKDSPEWGLLEEGALRNIMYKNGNLKGPQDMVSTLDRYLGSTYAARLHTPEKLAALRAFRDDVARLIPDPRATNRSQTAYTISREMQAFGQKLLTGMGIGDLLTSGSVGGLAVAGAAGVAGSRAAGRAANQAIGMPKLIDSLRVAPLVGASGAATLMDQMREPKR